MDRTLDEAVAAFDDDALLKMMVAQVARTFPKFEGAPEPVKRARDRFVALASAAPVMRDAIRLLVEELDDPCRCVGAGIVLSEPCLAKVRAALRAADVEGQTP